MPTLPAHIDLARRAAIQISVSEIDNNRGYFLLGSTAPDMRAITKRPRHEYHFGTLDFDQIGDGVVTMLANHPHLKGLENNDPGLAFMAGYVSHIVLDESWIFDVYRPNFGNYKTLNEGARLQVLDGALQLELDRRVRAPLSQSIAEIENATLPLGLGFLSDQAISDWRKWVIEFLGHSFSWDRLRFMARRISKGDESHPAHAFAEEFLILMPDSLDNLLKLVSHTEEVEEFTGRSIDIMGRQIEEFLS